MSTASRSLVLLTQRYKPSLSLDFRSALPADVTFTRASAGYYTNSDGTLTAFSSGVARTGDRGLLIEEARTNLLLRSQEFDNAAWTKAAASISANATAAPDGTTTADKLVEDNTTAIHQVRQPITPSASTTYVFTAFAKAAERSSINLYLSGGGASDVTARFDLSGAGTVTGTGTIDALDDGWYRCSISVTTASTASLLGYVLLSDGSSFNYAGDGSSGAYIWQADLQVDAFPTSPITTTSSTVTRAADVATITGVDSAPWFNASEGTVVEGFNLPVVIGTRPVLEVNDGTSNNRFTFQSESGTLKAYAITSGVVQAELNLGSISANIDYQMAFAYTANNFAACLNGGSVVSDTSGTVPTVDRMTIGARENASEASFGYIRSLAYYPRRLPNAVLVGLTA